MQERHVKKKQHAPRRADAGAIAPATGLDRRRPIATPPTRSTATVAMAASAAVAARVERREDEAISSCFDFQRMRSRRGRDKALKTPSKTPSNLRILEGDEIIS